MEELKEIMKRLRVSADAKAAKISQMVDGPEKTQEKKDLMKALELLKRFEELS